MDFVTDEREGGGDRSDAGENEADVAGRAGVEETKPGEDERNADPGEDDDLMKGLEGHGRYGFIDCGSE
jgi:hypothetical protein